ncbi:MAG TPA: RcpC/CpaB family pilus assembly protein [Actinomycetota bacterium]|nr:RcpC/CpaB family pilus assembly protein [Actinomycetota bacterium]
MRSRGLVVAIAVVLAVAAAAAVILYTQGVKEDAEQGGALQTVIVSSVEIRANESLNPLVAQDVFKQIRVPQDALVSGAVTDISQLEDATTTSTILANEQIPISRLSSGPRPNELGISEGHIGVAVELEAPQGGTGNVQPGDNVSVFATYQNVQAIAGNLRQAVNNPTATDTGRKVDLPDFTVTLIPTVKVLRIQNPEVDSETGQQSDSDRIRITLDLLPEDAQNLVFAQENGLVWLGLLPPDEEGSQPDASVVPLKLLLGARLG